MGLLGSLKRKLRPPMEEVEAKRQENFERIMKELDYKSASAKRQELVALKKREILDRRKHAQELIPSPTQSAGSPAPDYTKGIADALNFNPFNPPKKEAKRRDNEAT